VSRLQERNQATQCHPSKGPTRERCNLTDTTPRGAAQPSTPSGAGLRVEPQPIHSTLKKDKHTQGGLKNQGLQAPRHMRLSPTPTSAGLEHRHSLRAGPKRAIRRRPQTIDTEGAPISRPLRNTMHDTPKAQALPCAVYIRNDKSMLEPQKASSGLGVLLSDLSWFYPGGQCHSCCGERAHV
jgi:hypothetical protein